MDIKEIIVDKVTKISCGDEKETIQLKLVISFFALIAITFSVFNIISKSYPLLIATSSFALLCIINLIIIKFVKNGLNIAKLLFEIEMIVLFTYFTISGGIEGFSIIWLLVLPTTGMLFFGRKSGLILSISMFVILIVFMLVPFSFVYDYTYTLRLRFPFIYLSVTIISYLLELLREVNYKELKKLQEKYEKLYSMDSLTSTYNRYGFTSAFHALLQNDENSKIGLCILDIDDFKLVNDTYGHLFGDEVLKKIAEVLKETTPDPTENDVFRWGGEEFAVLFHDIDSEEAISICEQIRTNVEKIEMKCNDATIKVTISLGLIITTCMKDKVELEKRLYQADNLLYEAKASGKNCLKFYDYTK